MPGVESDSPASLLVSHWLLTMMIEMHTITSTNKPQGLSRPLVSVSFGFCFPAEQSFGRKVNNEHVGNVCGTSAGRDACMSFIHVCMYLHLVGCRRKDGERKARSLGSNVVQT